MNWTKQKLEEVSPKKVIIGLFVLMFAIELILDSRVALKVELLIGALLMLYGLYILKRRDYVNLKFLFLLLLIVKAISLVVRAL